MTTATQLDDESRSLWPEGAPLAMGNALEDQPALTVRLPPADRATGYGVIVAPGGGYVLLASDHEGLYAKRHPSDAELLHVEIVEGATFVFDVRSR